MVENIAIKNFKSIREMNLRLLPINILIGGNGVGKSNFIGFFTLLRYLYHQDLQNYIAAKDGAENLLYFGLKKSDNLSFRIEFDQKNAYHAILKPTQSGSLFFEIEEHQFHTGYKWSNSIIGKGDKESHLIEKGEARYYYLSNYMESFQVFHFHDTSDTAAIKQKCNIDDNRYLKKDASNLAAYLYFLQEKHPKDFKKIEMTIRAVAPFFERFLLAPDRINENKIRLEWKEKDSDMYLNATHLSDGTLRFMALVTLFLQPNLPKVIIIDEPELGLHPSAIHRLAALIDNASAQSQIIVATQSVTLVDNFTPEDIITVDRMDNQSVFVRQSSETLADWLQNYSIGDLWNKNVIGGIP